MSGIGEAATAAAGISHGAIAFFVVLAATGIGAAGLLAGVETGLYSLSQVRLAVRASRGDSGAARLSREQRRPQRLLSALLVTHAVASWLASFGVSQILDGLGFDPIEAVLIDLAVLVPVVFIFGEVLPKDLFRVNADRWMPRYAGLLRALRVALTVSGIVPVVSWLGGLAARLLGARGEGETGEARARVAAMLAEGAGSGGLSDTQLGFADRVFTMRGISIGQEMRPWKGVAAIAENAAPSERAQAFLASGASRLPVVSQTGSVVGVVSAVDHMGSPLAATRAIARKVLVLPPALSALDAIGRMRRERVQLAVVAERENRPLGIVTMKDLVEPLVGDLAAW